MKNLKDKKILVVICGGIAAYKSLETIRILKKNRCKIKTILTKSAKEFERLYQLHPYHKEKFMMTFSMWKMKVKWIILLCLDGLT